MGNADGASVRESRASVWFTARCAWVKFTEEATAHGCIRLIDESGEDYAFTAEHFHIVQHVPHAVGRAITGQAARRSRRRRPRMKQ